MDRVAKASFTEIKKNLDPRLCYLIIENRSKNGLITDFDVILERLAAFGEDIPTRTFYEDGATGKMLLVVPFEKNLEEKIGEIVIFSMLPDHLVFYLYKCSAGDDPHTVTEL